MKEGGGCTSALFKDFLDKFISLYVLAIPASAVLHFLPVGDVVVGG